MDNYRKLLHKMATAGKIVDLIKDLVFEIIEEELSVFFHYFDMTFLQLFPNFVEDSQLLSEGEAIQLNPDSCLIPYRGSMPLSGGDHRYVRSPF
jgi:hypothetical protein